MSKTAKKHVMTKSYFEVNGVNKQKLAKADVSLILMPFAPIERPSIGLGLLKSALTKQGIVAKNHYANIGFAEKIGTKEYNRLSTVPTESLLAEWVFSKQAFPNFNIEDEFYLKQWETKQLSKSELQSFRNLVSEYINELAEIVLCDNPKIVGCSSVFQQHCASLAILRRIREIAPKVVTIMGGANCEGVLWGGPITMHLTGLIMFFQANRTTLFQSCVRRY